MAFWTSIAAVAKTASRCPVKCPSVVSTRAVLCFSTRSINSVRSPQKHGSLTANTSPILRYSRHERTMPSPWATVSSNSARYAKAAVGARPLSAEAVIYDDPPPASEVDPNAAEDEATIKDLAESGAWEEARKILHSIRTRNMKPSMEASVSVVAVLRRALKYEDAEICYMDMIKEHMPVEPEDVFTKYSAPAPEDETKRVSARSFAIARMMQEDKDNVVIKDEETYRGLLLNLQDDGCWQAALLLAEQAEREKVTLEHYSVNVLCSLMTAAGYEDVATMLYQKLIVERSDFLSADSRAISEAPWKPESIAKNNLDLHCLTVSASLATVRIALTDLVRRPTTRPVMNCDNVVRIVTGLGKNSEGGEAVIKPQVLRLLDTLKIKHNFQGNNEGCIEIDPRDVKAFMERITSDEGAARLPPLPLENYTNNNERDAKEE